MVPGPAEVLGHLLGGLAAGVIGAVPLIGYQTEVAGLAGYLLLSSVEE